MVKRVPRITMLLDLLSGQLVFAPSCPLGILASDRSIKQKERWSLNEALGEVGSSLSVMMGA